MRKVTHRPVSELNGPHFSTMQACESHPPDRAWKIYEAEHPLVVNLDVVELRATLAKLVAVFGAVQLDWNDGSQAGSRCLDAIEEAERVLSLTRD
jgi:hypothetical protein